MLVLKTVITGPEPCVYLPEQKMTMENVVVLRLSPAEYERKMDEGWRKFGPVLFRPICEGCRACRSLRISVEAFTPSRSQRRALTGSAALTVRFDTPVIDPVRLALYNRYHATKERQHGWPEAEKSVEDYTFSFLQSPVPVVEISVWEEESLLAVVIAEVTPNTVSGVYHYYEPSEEKRSLGTFAMLQTLELARLLKKPWAYFGYYVQDCPSLSYKAKFRPCELLGEDGIWRPTDSDRAY